MTDVTHTPFVTHSQVARFAEERVNLHRDDVSEHREQANRLRQRLAEHIAENPEFALEKMLLSGSLAKGTALSSFNDIDVAVYMKAGDAPQGLSEMLPWLADRLRDAYGGVLQPDQIQPQLHSVSVSFRGSGLDVDVVPVYYDGDPQDRGFLVAQDTGQRVLTSIPLHLQFIRKRKDAQQKHFAQLVRLVKWWADRLKTADQDFRMKSFMIELLCAHLADQGLMMSDYPVALEEFFGFVVRTGLNGRISFDDYYQSADLPPARVGPIEVFDPVNPENNVAGQYSEANRLRIVEAAQDALDSLNEAYYADTKTRAVDCWQRLMGPSLQA